MPKYKIVNEGDSFFTIQGVPIFEMHTDRGFPCNTEWMNAAIKNHLHHKEGGYRPTIFVGHNVRGQEKESVGFLDNLVLRGKRLYADYVRVPKIMKEKIARNAFPSRSVEILPKSKRILALALLGSTTPHFPLPQMTYEEEDNETHLFFRSPEMAEMTEEQKKELYDNVAGIVNEAIPDAFAKFFKSDGEDGSEALVFVDTESGEEYAIPAALAAILAKAKGAGAAIKGAGAVAKGAGAAAGKAAGKVGRFVKRHPTAAGASAALAGGAVIGTAAHKRLQKRKYAVQGYQIDNETGVVYLDGEPLGEIFTYDEMAEVGMDVPTAVKKPQKLPKVGPTADPQLEISEDDVGIGSRNVAAAETAPPAVAGAIVQPLDRAESEQFEEEVATELYELQQEVDQLKTANALISEGRKAELYTKWLEDQRTAGVPVGDIEKTVDFMMSQTVEQVDAYKKLLMAQPKVAFAKAEETLSFARIGSTESEAEIKADYEQNKATYQTMGVSDKDLKYAKYVRINQAVGEIQPSAV